VRVVLVCMRLIEEGNEGRAGVARWGGLEGKGRGDLCCEVLDEGEGGAGSGGT
jgi:hypothetical protein